MARYWVGGTGNLDGVDTTHIAATSGGAGGASYPGAGDTLTFDSASGGGTVTFTATLSVATLSCGAFTGTIDTNGQTVNIGAGNFSISGTGSRTISLGSSTINVAGAWLASVTTNLTFNAGTSTIAVSSSGNQFDGGGLTYATVTIVCPGSMKSLSGSNTFGTLTVTGSASAAGGLSLSGSQTVTGTLTISGNSITNRVLVGSSVKGTARTLTAATVSCSNADFQDITGAGAGSWNLSGITGGSGDCGGNSGITFTTGATQYWYTATTGAKTWSTAGNWYLGSGGTGGAGRVPLPQDTARFDSASIGAASTSISIDMPRLPGMDWTGVTNSPAMSKGFASSFFGSITWHSTLTWSGSAFGWTYEGRGSSVWTHSGMPSWTGGITVTAPGGTLTFGGAFTTAETVLYSQGTLADGGYTITCAALSDSGSLTRALVASGNWIVTGQATNIIFLTPTGNSVTFSGTIRFTGTLTAARNFYFAGFTFGGIEFATSGAFANQIQTAPVVSGTLHIDASVAARTILFEAGTTTTVGSMTRDAGTNVITIGSITAANHNLVKSGGGNIPSLHHMSISRSQATPNTNTWYAGFGSTDGGNNSGWIFGTIPNQSTTATVASHSFIAKSGTTSSIFRTSATAARFTFSALSGLTRSAITVPATVASFVFNAASATAKGIATVAATAASFVFSALNGTTSVVNPDPRIIAVTVSVSPNPAIVVSRSSYSITVSR